MLQKGVIPLCRMLLANRSGVSRLIERLEETPGCRTLSAFLRGLELRDGGNGNGVVLFGDGEILHYERAVDMQPERAAAILEGREYDWAVFHSREASTGSIRDENCHPFVIDGKHHLVMAVNGNETHMSSLSRVIGDKTDSEFIARMIVDMDLPFPETLSCFCSNFIGIYDGKAFAKKGDRQLLKFQSGKDIVFASDFPFSMTEISKPEQNYCWFDWNESIMGKDI